MAESSHLFAPESGSKRYTVLSTVLKEAMRPTSFDIVVVSGTSGWRKNLSNRELSVLAKQANMDVTEYNSITEKALTGIDTNLFELEIKSVGQNLSLKWKKLVSQKSTAKFLLGNISLLALSSHQLAQAAEQVYKFSIDCIGELRERAIFAEQENRRLALERNEALEKVDEAVEAKTTLETEIFEKFTEVLNSKKRKIRQLTDEISELKRNQTDVRTAVGKEEDSRAAASSTSTKDVQEEGEESGQDTDEENEVLEQQREIASIKRQHSKTTVEPSTTQEPQEDDNLFVPKRRRGRSSKNDKSKDTNSKSSKEPSVKRSSRSTRSSVGSSANDSILDKLS